jgi:hypothetical protein
MSIKQKRGSILFFFNHRRSARDHLFGTLPYCLLLILKDLEHCIESSAKDSSMSAADPFGSRFDLVAWKTAPAGDAERQLGAPCESEWDWSN